MMKAETLNGFTAVASDLIQHSGYLDTNVNKSASQPAEEQLDTPDGPLPGAVSDREEKVRSSPAKMSTKKSTDLVEYDNRDEHFLPDIQNNDRSHFHSRLNNQERTITFLLEQAFHIKEELSACLQGTKGYKAEESLARKLLENHIHTITAIVKKLSQNIEILENQIRIRDQMTTGTNYAVQELNNKHLQGVGDLRGRVARCDSSIMKLSGDIHFIRQEHQQVEKAIQELLAAIETVSKNLDVKVLHLLGKIESSHSEQTSNLKIIQGDYRHEMNLLELKFNALSNNVYEELENQEKWAENQFMKYGKDHLDSINQCMQLLHEQLERSENKLEQKLLQLSSKLENLINLQKQEAELNSIRKIENKLYKKMNLLEKLIWGELEKMQSEYQTGFKSIHDSLGSLQQIQKTKMDLEKHKVQKDIRKLQRKIGELHDI
ncbi:protein FAM81B [Sorex araneus]|uniref:protein FAM81B n=1 Tax=Sorex araneus TaxID=42254 RepID=UPI002433CCDD|nr:protein FAM81B [Sorex araneus]